MTIQIDAVYEAGAFRPVEKVSFQDGMRVVLTIESPATLAPPQLLVAELDRIARMPSQSNDDGFSGADHDQILYGTQGAR
jgi:predicted DNA-binding antitoxin AbrB/MazE fold protein